MSLSNARALAFNVSRTRVTGEGSTLSGAAVSGAQSSTVTGGTKSRV